MAVRHYLIGIIAALLVVSSLSSSSTNENDGGMGIDAGNTVASALKLTSLASVAGTLSAVDDRDWYYEDRVDTTSPACMDATFVSEHMSTMRLSVVSGSSVRETVGERGGLNGIAAPGFSGAFFEVSGDPMTFPPLRAYSTTSAVIALSSSLPINNDGNTGVDANASNPVAITAGCVLGATKASQGDATDVYTLAGTAGNTILVSLASATSGASLVVASPSGTTLATLGPGGLAALTLPTNGTYTMTASSSSNGLTTYAIGTCEPRCSPPQHPCEPMCIDLVRDS